MAEADLAEITATLEEVQKAKSDAEEKAATYAREKTQLQSQLDENEEELAEVIPKFCYLICVVVFSLYVLSDGELNERFVF